MRLHLLQLWSKLRKWFDLFLALVTKSYEPLSRRKYSTIADSELAREAFGLEGSSLSHSSKS